MNKSGVIKKLMEKTGLSENECIVLNDIIETHGFVGVNAKEKIIADVKTKLNADDGKAKEIYENAMSVFAGGIKDRLLHPFGDKH